MECFFNSLDILGIDEISLQKAHKDFVAIITARINEQTKLIAILPDRKKDTVKQFLKSIPENLLATKKLLARTCVMDIYMLF